MVAEIPNEDKRLRRTLVTAKETEMATSPVKKKALETTNITDILDQPSTEIGRPTPPPQGHYVATVRGMYTEEKSAKKQTRGHKFTMQLIQPVVDDNGENVDVDPEALEAALTKPDGSVMALTDKTLPYTLWVTDNSMWRYKDFLTHLGIPETEDDGTVLSTRQRAELSPGRSCIITVAHTPSQDGTAVFANIVGTAALPEE